MEPILLNRNNDHNDAIVVAVLNDMNNAGVDDDDLPVPDNVLVPGNTGQQERNIRKYRKE